MSEELNNGRKREEGATKKRSERLWGKETAQRETGEKCGMCDSVLCPDEMEMVQQSPHHSSASITIEISQVRADD